MDIKPFVEKKDVWINIAIDNVFGVDECDTFRCLLYPFLSQLTGNGIRVLGCHLAAHIAVGSQLKPEAILVFAQILRESFVVS